MSLVEGTARVLVFRFVTGGSNEELGGRKRLQEVVTGRSDKTGAGGIGALGLGQCGAQIFGAGCHTRFQ
ncbi:hypothetical protein D3C71_2118590 [compost metagenome]